MVQQRVRFSEVRGDLPMSSWYRRHADRFEHADVWVLDADTSLGMLDLDAPGVADAGHGGDNGVDADIALVLVKGNLHVTGSIFNACSDGSVGLVVLGSLEAENMIVGGQVIEVSGDLRVRELFWGDYNHGMLTVAGRAGARFWLATDEYRYEIADGPGVGAAHWDDDSRDALPPPPCHATLSPWFPEALIAPGAGPGDGVSGWLSREAFIAAARVGRSLLKPAAAPATRPPRIASDALTADNLQGLLQTVLAEGPVIKQCSQIGTDPFWRLSFPVGDYRGGLYVEVANRRYFAKPQEAAPGRLGRLLGAKPGLALVVEFTDEVGEAPVWRDLSAEEVARDDTLQAVWRACLATIARAEPVWQQLSSEVTVARIEGFLDLPFVRSNFENYDDDHEYGHYTLAVRQASEGTPRVCLGWQGSDTRDEDGDREYCWAHFVVTTSEDGRKQAEIDFQPRTSGGKVYDARCFLARLPEVLSAFQAIKAILVAEQAASAERDAAPVEADLAALEAWLDDASALATRLDAPDRFLEALGRLAFDADRLDAVLALCARATHALAGRAEVKTLLALRRKCGYWLHEAKRFEEARAANRALLADAQALLGQRDAWLCPLLINLAQNSYELGDIADAAACLESTLDIGLTHADGWAVDQALFQLGVLSHEQGDDARARDHFERRLAHAQLAGDRALIAAAEQSLSEWARRARRVGSGAQA